MQKGTVGREIAVLIAQVVVIATGMTLSGMPMFAGPAMVIPAGFCWSAVWMERHLR